MEPEATEGRVPWRPMLALSLTGLLTYGITIGTCLSVWVARPIPMLGLVVAVALFVTAGFLAKRFYGTVYAIAVWVGGGLALLPLIAAAVLMVGKK
ncbi:MAG TPA: hypothetical protein VMI11_08355 [Actinomycetes bacterium]|nr:hypothetical protein [Actinomycetes bacterium]